MLDALMLSDECAIRAERHQAVRQLTPAGIRRVGHLCENARLMEEAEIWYRLAADAGDLQSVVNTGVMLKNRGLLEEAALWYRRAAQQGHPEAPLFLSGLLLRMGELEEAEAFGHAALRGGDVRAAANLGLIARSRGDLATAERYLERLRPWKWCSGLDLIRGFVPASGLVPA